MSQIYWAVDDGFKYMLSVMQSDVMLNQGNKILIIDAKFYTHTTQKYHNVSRLHSNNLYQIFTYVKNATISLGLEPDKVSGMLLYAHTDEKIQPNNVYMMNGNRISVKTLNLNKDFSKIAAQLNSIVTDHF